jgi:LysM repeat protein
MTDKSKKQLMFEFVVVCFAIIVPVSAHANFLSRLFDTADAEIIEPVTYSQDTNAQLVPLLKAAIHTDPNPAKGGGDIIISEGALVPSGDIDGEDETVNTKTSNGEISVYVVREGDTLSQIAAMYDVSSKTILWANDISDASLIQPGDSLIILPITGVRHVVKDGDSLGKIAKKYDGDVDDILAYNQLTSADEISIGDTIVIPGGEIEAPTPTRTYSNTTVVSGAGSAGFTHPLPGSARTQGIHGYNGVDFGAPVGTPIKAAAAGNVIVARGSGWNGGYGLYVVVKHSNGTQTLYSHMSRLAVSVGSSVSQGQTIGYVGNSGRSTGSHLHFEVRGARNPF